MPLGLSTRFARRLAGDSGRVNVAALARKARIALAIYEIGSKATDDTDNTDRTC